MLYRKRVAVPERTRIYTNFQQRVSEWEEGHFERTRPMGLVRWGLAPPKKKVYPGKWYNPSHPAL
jgi:hypothetical protein